jgi:hypothetical protein
VARSHVAVAALCFVAGACSTSSSAGTSGSTPVPRHSPTPVTTSFRGHGTLSLKSPVPFPVIRSVMYGASDAYVLTSGATGQTTRSCFSSGGWKQRVPAAGGGTTTLDLTSPPFYQVLSSFLGVRPGLAIGLAELRRPPAHTPARWQRTFSVPASALAGLAARLAPAAVRDGARQATAAAAGSARGPIRVTAWWSSTQRDLPRRVRLVLNERAGAGDETVVIAWAFTVPGRSVMHC